MTDDLYERYKEALRSGHVAALRGRLEEALEAYRLAAQLAPARAMPHSSLGGIYLRLNRVEEALAEYAAAVARAPQDEGSLLGQAEALEVVGRDEDAAAALDRVAQIQEASGRLPEAADTLRRALELHDSPERVRRQRSLVRQIRLSAGDQAAEQALARALRLREPAEQQSGPEPAPAIARSAAPQVHAKATGTSRLGANLDAAAAAMQAPARAAAIEPASPPASAPAPQPHADAEATPWGETDEQAVAMRLAAVSSYVPRKPASRVAAAAGAATIAASPVEDPDPASAMAGESGEPAESMTPMSSSPVAAPPEPAVRPEPAPAEAVAPASAPEPQQADREAIAWPAADVRRTRIEPAAPTPAPTAATAEAHAEPEREPVGVIDVGDPNGGGTRTAVPLPSGDELIAAAEESDRGGNADESRRLLVAAARAYSSEGRFEAALDTAHQVLRRHPSDVDGHLALVELYVSRRWDSLAAEKLLLLGRLAELDGDDTTKARLCEAASHAFPSNGRLAALCS